MTAQHTPGPWIFGWETIARDWAIVTDSSHAIIANVNTETGPSGASVPAMQIMPAEANARLIAAAPEMLAALELCIPANACLTNRNIPDDMTVPLDVPMGDLRKIAAAIAKATRPVAELEKGNRDG